MIPTRNQIDTTLLWMKHTVTDLSNPFYNLCMIVLNDTRFHVSVGSAGKHHFYEGGLVIHTGEVLETALHLSNIYRGADTEVLTVAAIYHDYMKVREYNPLIKGTGVYSDGSPVLCDKTSYRNLVRHVAGSHSEFLRNLDDEAMLPLNPEFENKVLLIEHAILAHHGRQDWGSPVEPQTVEARILHSADMLSMQYGVGA